MKKRPARFALAVIFLGSLLGLFGAPRIKVGLGHSGSVKAVAFSPDGKFLLSVAVDRSLKLWDAATGRELRTLPASDSYIVESVAFTPDGRAAIYWPNGGPTTLWDLASGQEIKPFHVSGKASREHQRTFYSGDRRTAFVLAGLGAPALEVWDEATGRIRKAFPKHPIGEADKVVASRDGTRLASMLMSQPPRSLSVNLWDTATGRKVATLRGHTKDVSDAAFAPDGKTLITASADKTLKLWEVRTGRLLRTFLGHGEAVMSVGFSPDGLHALSGSWDNTLKLWDVASGKVLKTLAGHGGFVNSVAFSPDGLTALSGSDDHTLKLWDLNTGQELRTLASPAESVESLALSGNQVIAVYGKTSILQEESAVGDRRFASGLVHQLKSWDFPWGRKGFSCPEEIELMAMAPDGKTLLTSNGDSPLVLRDGTTGEALRTFQRATGPLYRPLSLAFSPDGRRAFTSALEAPVKVWDVASGRELRSLPLPRKLAEAPLLSPDGRWAVLLPEPIPPSESCPILIMDLESGRTIREFPGHADKIRAVAFSPDGNRLLSASYAAPMKLWDLGTEREIMSLKGGEEEVTAMVFSQDGKTAITGSHTGALQAWDLASGALLRTFRGHGDGITTLALSQDGTTLFSGSEDGTIRTWDTARGRELTATMVDNNEEWLTWTPEGDFEGTSKAAHDYVYVVDGFQTMAIDQAYGVYYRPDRVQAAFLNRSDQPAPERLSLTELFQGGLAPAVAFAGDGGVSERRDLDIVLRVKPGTGGVGRLTIFLDGTPIILSEGERGVKVLEGVAAPGPEREFRHTVTLHPGRNLLEASVFNQAGTIESARASRVVTWSGKGGDPRLFVLAVAIDAYRDGDLRLKYPVADARSLEATFTSHAPGLFLPGGVRTLYDGEATRDGIGKAFDGLASLIGPDDVFLLYLAGHGVAFEGDGDYYFLPVDFRFTGKEAIQASGLSKGFIVEHLARIKASKSIVLFDTCNSGAFLSGGTRGISEKTAVDRLKRAMGRATVVASANDQSAMEGYEGHGVFTWALLEGLSGKADSNKDGFITVTELTSYIENLVPEITYRKWGYEQIPQKELPREDFPIARIPPTSNPGSNPQ